MIEIALMIEGQHGLNWTRWKNITRAAEDLGYNGVFRSDHFVDASPPNMDSLELWVSLSWLASHTSRITFGPLVTPFSFRHPTLTARMAAAVDDLSNGRLNLGLGAGWQEREHHMFGLDLLDMDQRFQRYEEGLQVVTRLLKNDEPVNFDGKYYHLREAVLLPRPSRKGGPPVIIGGNGEKRTLPLAARFADEWNAVYLTTEEFVRRNRRLDQLLMEHHRQPASVRRSLMLGSVFGKTPAEVEQKASARSKGKAGPQELRQRGLLVGTGEEIKEQVQAYEKNGAQRIMIQWLDLDDLEGIETLAKSLFR